jgi:hypothetical protein
MDHSVRITVVGDEEKTALITHLRADSSSFSS